LNAATLVFCYEDAHELRRNTENDAGKFHWGCIVLRVMP
jgi:hypothetical protein